MNISSGNSSRKEHLAKGSTTACNRKVSTGKSEKDKFKFYAENYPESCCSACLKQYNSK